MKKNENKIQVCILAAGVGSRMGDLSSTISKALLPIKDKAVISHIIEKFPKTSKFVIAVGYKSIQIKDYLCAAYPNLEFKFIVVDNYNGFGSGPGYSLLKCKKFLNNKPFYFSVGDAFYNFNIPFDIRDNWAGVSRVNFATSKDYCNFNIENGQITNMYDKKLYINENSKSFSGLAYIQDVKEFWLGVEDNYLVKGEHQMTNGLFALIKKKLLKPLDLEWIDLGSYERYTEEVEKENRYNFSKMDEYLYFVNDKVIKFFKDENIVKNRIKKAENKNIFPDIEYEGRQFYSYSYILGDTMYKKVTLKSFNNLLYWLKHTVWQKDKRNISQECKIFYKEKTYKRLGLLLDKYPNIDIERELEINGKTCKSMKFLLDKLDWDYLCKNSINSFIHGDLQFDNILVTNNDQFKLIDWRQDFAGFIDGGDIYYDLAKLYGGLMINYDIIKENHFNYIEEEDKIYVDFYTRYFMKKYIKIFEKFVVNEGYELYKIKLLAAIIYLNMSPLHQYPFDKMLFAFSNYILDGLL